MDTRRTVTAPGITLDVHDSGPGPGEAVLLLHGFPQDASAWEAVTPPLVEAGYRVLAPDQRGYSPGARPRERSAYRQAALAADALAVLDDAGVERAHVVGHDWGGVLAWTLGGRHADRVRSLTVLSTPHPRALREAMVHGQALRSGYIAGLQLPLLPELLLGAGGARALRTVLRASGLPGPYAERYVARLTEPGALSGALGWYRALPGDPASAGRTAVPTLFVWGEKDPALGRRAAEGTGRCVSADYRFVPLPGVGHWLPETAADVVLPLLLDHLAAHPG